MASPSTSIPNMSLTSLPGTTGGGGTTTTNLETVAVGAPSTTASGLPVITGVTVNSPQVNLPTQVAVLPLSDTTLTAYGIPGTTGLAILDDQTLTWRHDGITLSDGNVVSLGFDGLVVSTTTATYSPFVSLTSSYPIPTAPGPVIFSGTSFPALANSTMTNASGTMGSQTSGGSMATLTTSASQSGSAGMTGGAGSGGSSGGSSGQSATPASQTGNAAPTLSAGKAAVLLGAVGGMAVFGL